MHIYQDSKEASKAIFEYIELWYNRKRIHSAIDYMTFQQKEDMELNKRAYPSIGGEDMPLVKVEWLF